MLLPDAQIVPLLETHFYPGCWSEMIWLIQWEFGRVSAIHFVIYLFPTLPRPPAFSLRRILAREKKMAAIVNSTFSKKKLLPAAPFLSLFFKARLSFWAFNFEIITLCYDTFIGLKGSIDIDT